MPISRGLRPMAAYFDSGVGSAPIDPLFQPPSSLPRDDYNPPKRTIHRSDAFTWKGVVLRSLQSIARKAIPFSWRVEFARLRRRPRWVLEHRTMALEKAPDASEFGFPIAEQRSPLIRPGTTPDARLQEGKEKNVSLAAGCIDRVVIHPGQVFSFHHLVGRTTRRKGYLPGLELRNGALTEGVGGGCCQISNLLYLLFLRAGLDVVERHRHGLDLFPDHGRTVPFGCGATVFFNYADLRVRNPLTQDVLVRLTLEDGFLTGRIFSRCETDTRIEVYEVDHKIARDGDGYLRENRIRRRFVDGEGQVVKDEEVAHNKGRCMYDPEDVPE